MNNVFAEYDADVSVVVAGLMEHPTLFATLMRKAVNAHETNDDIAYIATMRKIVTSFEDAVVDLCVKCMEKKEPGTECVCDTESTDLFTSIEGIPLHARVYMCEGCGRVYDYSNGAIKHADAVKYISIEEYRNHQYNISP